jgi:hypothetical protein
MRYMNLPRVGGGIFLSALYRARQVQQRQAQSASAQSQSSSSSWLKWAVIIAAIWLLWEVLF